MPLFHIGLIVNPLAGVGGPAGFKGSDGMAEAALAAGVEPRAAERTRTALEVLLPLRERLLFRTFAGAMGAELLAEMGFAHEVLGISAGAVSHASDTRLAVQRLQEAGHIIHRPPRDGHMAFVKSPDGISVELLQEGHLPPQEPWASMENTGSW